MVTASNTFAQSSYQRLVRKFETPKLGIPNPAGLVYSPRANALLVAPASGTRDFIIVSFAPDVIGSATVTATVPDPANMAFDDKSNSLMVFDASVEELTELRAEANGRPSTGVISRFNVQPFSARQAKGMTFDPRTGDLFFLVPSAVDVPRIVRIAPDPQTRFDGLEAQREGRITNIPLNSLRGVELRGIAFNPNDGHLYVVNPAEQILFEISQTGDVLTTRDLSKFELGDIQSIVFAPSGDQTDDPAVMNLYIVDSNLNSPTPGSRKASNSIMSLADGTGDIAELSLAEPATLDLSAITAPGTLIQTILTSDWSPPSPDASGAAYIPSLNSLFVSDGEVNEMPIFAGVNVWQATLTGGQVQEFSTTAFSDEPSGVAFNPNNQHLFFTDDTGTRSVYELDPGPDGLYGTGDDIVTSFGTAAFSSNDPEGITYDLFQGRLFMADGVNNEVYQINPGSNGIFDGVPPAGDDIVSSFDTSILGMLDPEGVEFNPDTGTLYIVGDSGDNDFVVETTADGNPVNVIDFSSANARKKAGVAYAPGSLNPAERSLYIVDRGVDNDSDPNENDGRIYEIAIGSSTPTTFIDDVVVVEGNTGTVNAQFTVSLTAISQQTITVDYTTSDGSAIAGSDYIAASGQVTFQPGQTSRPLVVQVNGDETDEPDETFFVNLSNAVNASIGDDQGVGTITNDDGPDPVAVSFQDGVNGYSGTRDTRLVFDTPGTNYGSDETLFVDGSPDQSSLLYWDLASIPSGSIIESADITVNVTNTSGADYEIYALLRPWVEGEATWNAYASGQNWQVGGADGSGDRGSTVLGAIIGSTTGSNTFSLNLAGVAVIQSWVDNPSSNRGFIVQDYINHNNDVRFSSREVPTATERPRLTVTFLPGQPQLPSLFIDDVTVTEGNTGTVNANFTVTLSAASGQTVSVDYATANGTATAGSDYVAVSGQLSFQPGVTSQPVTVVVNGDVVDEPNETFVVNLSNAVGATIADNQGTGTITDDDGAPSLSIDDVTVTEGNTGTVNANFTVTLSAASGQAVSVDYATVNGTATAGSDYVAVSGQVSFPPGVTSQPVTVTVNGDVVDEPNETFFVNLSNAVNATMADNEGVGTITNDDIGGGEPVTVSFQDGLNGYSGARDTKLMSQTPTTNFGTAPELELDGSPDRSALLYWDLASIPPGSIVQSAGVTVNITNSSGHTYEFYQLLRSWVESEANWNQYASGQNWQVAGADGSADRGSTVLGILTGGGGLSTISLNAAGIAVVQAWVNNPFSNRGFIIQDYLNASNGLDFSSRETGTPSNRPRLTVTYTTDGGPPPPPSLSINDVTVTEGNTGTVNANFTVTLSSSSSQLVTVNYATASGTATAGSDYVAVSGQLSFLPGVISQPLTVVVNGDVIDESNETFLVNLSNAVNATIADNQGIGTITDDDGAPSLSINDVTVTEGNTGTVNANFTVTLSSSSSQLVTVNYATANGTATAGSDYVAVSGQLSFQPGVTSQPVTVVVNGDAVNEPNETFFVNLSNAVNATIVDNQGTGTIANDDGTPSLSINNVTVTEGNTGTVNAIFAVTLSATSSQVVTVNYATANGTASAGSDYVAVSGQVSFQPGVTSQPVTVVVNGDVIDEPNETFFVNLSDAVNATIADNQGLGTITDNDNPPSLAIDDVVVTEGNSGTVGANFAVTLSGVSGQTVTVNYATANATATAGSDYVAVSGQLSFQPGVTSQPVTVTVNGDATVEPNETFLVNLTNAGNATIADNEGVGTITNDDIGSGEPVTVSFQDGLNGYNGTRDTKLMSLTPTTNFGTAPELELDGSPDRSSLLYWDLAGIPSGSIVQSVDVTVNITNSSSNTYEFYESLRSWVESEANWNQYASGQNWQVAGADGSADRGTTVLGVLTGSSGIATVTLNAAGIAVVQSWGDNPTSNLGFIIQDYINASNGLDFSSRETATISNRPRLTITYLSSGQAGGAPEALSKSGEAITSSAVLPETLALQPTYPNPFNLETSIEYALPEPGHVQLAVFNIRGQQVRLLVDEPQTAGFKNVSWDGRDGFGHAVGSGVYLIQLLVEQQSLVRMLSLQK
jgi:ribosomal protein L35AE/L33A